MHVLDTVVRASLTKLDSISIIDFAECFGTTGIRSRGSECIEGDVYVFKVMGILRLLEVFKVPYDCLIKFV
jgi:hypothetical protein